VTRPYTIYEPTYGDPYDNKDMDEQMIHVQKSKVTSYTDAVE
jgi:hypothetical protein